MDRWNPAADRTASGPQNSGLRSNPLLCHESGQGQRPVKRIACRVDDNGLRIQAQHLGTERLDESLACLAQTTSECDQG